MGHQTVEAFLLAPNKNTMHVMAASSVELEEVIKGMKNASAGWDGV